MKPLSNLLRILSLLFLVAAMPASAQPPVDSLYRLPLALTDQDGRVFQLADRSGHPQLISMFYASCQYTCPLTIEALKRNQAALVEAAHTPLDVLLVSFDSERDTPPRLKQVFAERKLDAKSWTLAHAEPRDVRKLAAALDIQYRVLEGGMINHSTVLVLLDAQGRVLARSEKLDAVDPDFVAALRGALAAH